MNILEVEDMIKGMPDNALMQEAQRPTGQVPQFLVVSELQRRGDMRKRYQAQQQQPQATVKDQIVMESMGAAQPQGIMAAQPQMATQQAPQQMFSGGIIRLANGGAAPASTLSALIAAGVKPTELIQRGYSLDEIQAASAKSNEIMGMPVSNMPESLAGVISEPERQSSDYLRRDESMLENPASAVRALSSGISDIGDAVSDALDERAMLSEVNQPNYEMLYSGETLDPGYKERLAAQREMDSKFTNELLRSAEATPLGQYFTNMYEEVGSASSGAKPIVAGQQLLGAVPAAIETAYEGLEPGVSSVGRYLEGILRPGIDYLFGEDNSGIAALESNRKPEPKPKPQVQAVDTDVAVQGKDGFGSLYEKNFAQVVTGTEGSKAPPGYVEDPELSAALALAQQSKDASAKEETDLQSFLSGLQEKTEKAGLTNALLALGAGVMEGKTGEGVRGAGTALADAQKRSSAIGLKGKLAEYEAQRADIARAETLASREKQYDKSLLQTKLNAIPDIIKQLQLERTQLAAYLTDDDPALKAIDDKIASYLNMFNAALAKTTSPAESGFRVISTR